MFPTEQHWFDPYIIIYISRSYLGFLLHADYTSLKSGSYIIINNLVTANVFGS